MVVFGTAWTKRKAFSSYIYIYIYIYIVLGVFNVWKNFFPQKSSGSALLCDHVSKLLSLWMFFFAVSISNLSNCTKAVFNIPETYHIHVFYVATRCKINWELSTKRNVPALAWGYFTLLPICYTTCHEICNLNTKKKQESVQSNIPSFLWTLEFSFSFLVNFELS